LLIGTASRTRLVVVSSMWNTALAAAVRLSARTTGFSAAATCSH